MSMSYIARIHQHLIDSPATDRSFPSLDSQASFPVLQRQLERVYACLRRVHVDKRDTPCYFLGKITETLTTTEHWGKKNTLKRLESIIAG